MRDVCMTKINKPIRISSDVLKELKTIRDNKKLKSYDAVLEKLIRKEKKLKK